jgi:1-acyl-sn-glycerol-3-phosphate acyltransferase
MRRELLPSLLASLWALASVLATACAILLAAPFLGPKRAFFAIAPWFARTLFRLRGIHWDVRGWEDLPEEIRSARRSVIFMANHESNLDPPALIAAVPVPVVFLAKQEVRWLPLVGWASMAAGVIFIDRGNRERSVRSIRRAAAEIHRGKSVLLFPEGTRTRTGALLPFKRGGFALALKARVPIVPMAAVGGFRIMPPGSLLVRAGSYTVLFGQPVNPQDHPTKDALLEEVRRRIAALRERAMLTAGDAP